MVNIGGTSSNYWRVILKVGHFVMTATAHTKHLINVKLSLVEDTGVMISIANEIQFRKHIL